MGYALVLYNWFYFQLKEKLKDCLHLMADAHSYFPSPPKDASSPAMCHCARCVAMPPPQPQGTPLTSASLLSLAEQVTAAHVHIALQQFDGYLAHSSRQVCTRPQYDY